MNLEKFENIIKEKGWNFSGSLNCVEPPALLYENKNFPDFYIFTYENMEAIGISDWKIPGKPILKFKEKENLTDFLSNIIINFIKREETIQ